ncbi:MAG: hypothetical protein AAGK01_12910 [Pseudomonadota bacterium]
MLSLLLASALQLPTSTETTARHLLRGMKFETEEQTAAARASLWINAKGKVRDCKLIGFVGDEIIAKRMCEKIIGARFSPAIDRDGNAAYSMFTTVLGASGGSVHRSGTGMNWLKGNGSLADVVVSVESMPKELAWNPLIELNVLIDGAGSIVACEAGEYRKPEWVRAACNQATAQVFEERASDQGLPISYVRNIGVKFELSR